MNVTIENFIGIFENAYSPEFCQKVIDTFEVCDKNGMTVNRQKDINSTLKTIKDDTQLYTEHTLKHMNMVGEFNNVFWNQVYPEYATKFAPLIESAAHATYAFKVQRTAVGQGYHVWHYESSTRDTAERILAWTLYLNDVEEGGETEFLYYPKRVKPKQGTLLLWPAGFTHTHRGNPPLSNTKYIVTGWVEF